MPTLSCPRSHAGRIMMTVLVAGIGTVVFSPAGLPLPF